MKQESTYCNSYESMLVLLDSQVHQKRYHNGFER